MKKLTLLLVATSLLLTAAQTTHGTYKIDQERKKHRESLSLDMDIRDSKRLQLIREREKKSRLALEKVMRKEENIVTGTGK